MVDATYPRVRQERQRVTRDALSGVFQDQWFRDLLDDAALTAVIFREDKVTASQIGRLVAESLDGPFDPDLMDDWLLEHASNTADSINAHTRSQLEEGERDEVFDLLIGVSAPRIARSLVTASANLGAQDAARAARGEEASKTWVWSGKGPRHQDLAGQTVGVDATFSNGMRWPGDPAGGADQTANCQCSLSVT